MNPTIYSVHACANEKILCGVYNFAIYYVLSWGKMIIIFFKWLVTIKIIDAFHWFV